MTPVKCSTCDGKGTVNDPAITGGKLYEEAWCKCPTCKGRGTVLSNLIPGGVDPGSPKAKTLL